LRAPREWRILHGVEFEQTLAHARRTWLERFEQAEIGERRFDENLEAVKDALAVDPFGPGYSRPLTPDQPQLATERIATTRDERAGYRMVFFYRVDRSGQTATLEWLVLEALPEDSL
jgi:hypothetical protein